MLPRPDFALHRAALLDRLADGEAVLLFATPHAVRNGDSEYRYRPDSDLYWLTGWTGPDAAIFLKRGEAPLTMFVQPRDPEQETWTGRRPGPEGARARYGADAAYAIEALEKELPRLLLGVHTLHYGFGRSAEDDALVSASIRKAERLARRSGVDVPETFHAPARLLHELRLHKSDDELAVLRKAAALTTDAHLAAMRVARPGRYEYEVEAAITHVFRAGGGDGPGYTPIVAGGDNANILHYHENDAVLGDGDLLLIDAGGEFALYTADVTRTFPVNGRFSEAQRRVYEVVLAAQEAAIAAAVVGARFLSVHEAAVRRLTEGMVALGLLEGDVDVLIANEAYKRFYMHGTSHWLGLDVHDAGRYARAGASRPLQPGMVITVEPGLYIPAAAEGVPEALRGIGVRIEDDVLITEDGPEVLTAAAPRTVADIEAALAARSDA
jgi:Xaa-Pro aminopeptidase